MTKTILIVDKIDNKIIAEARKHGDVVFAAGYPGEVVLENDLNLGKADIIIIRSTKVPRTTAQKTKPDVKFIRVGAGIDTLQGAIDEGREVQNTPGSNALGVVDLAIGFLGYALLENKLIARTETNSAAIEILQSIIRERQIKASIEAYKNNQEFKPSLSNEILADKDGNLSEDVLQTFRNNPIEGVAGKKILITGATGNTGRLMVQVTQALGMKVIAVEERKLTAAYAAKHGITLMNSIEDGLREADVISLHTALNNETKGKFTQAQFDLMKAGAIVINGARAGLFGDVETDILVLVDDNPKDVRNICGGMKNLIASGAKSGAKTKQSDERAVPIANKLLLACAAVVSPGSAASEASATQVPAILPSPAIGN